MRLKLRGKRNRKGQKAWAIYAMYGTGCARQEKLHKQLGIIPKPLAQKIFDQERLSVVCFNENIRQNADVSFEQACDEYLERKCRPPHKTPKTYHQNRTAFRQVKRMMRQVFDQHYSQRPNKTYWIHDLNLEV